MAAAVDLKKLIHTELKTQVLELEVAITSDRAILLRKGHKALTTCEERYLKLFAEMEARGLGAACQLPAPQARTISAPAPLRRQQHHPQIESLASRQNIPHPWNVPNRMIENH